MVAVDALHNAADLAVGQGLGGLLKGSHHLSGRGHVAVSPVQRAVRGGVLAVLGHQLVEQGLLVAGGLELGQQVLGQGLFLGHGGLVQRRILPGGVAVLVGEGAVGVHRLQKDVLGPVVPLALSKGAHLIVGGVAGAPLPVQLLLKLAVQVVHLKEGGVQVPGQGVVPEGVVQQLGAAGLGLHGGHQVAHLLGEVWGDGDPLRLSLDGEQGVQGGVVQGGVQDALFKGLAVAHIQLPDGVHGGGVLDGAVHQVGHPVQQASGGDVRAPGAGHHRVAGQAGGGQVGVGDRGQVDGLIPLGGRGGAVLAAAQGGQGQSKGQGEGSQPFQMGHKQSDSFLFKKVMGPEQGPLLGIIAQRSGGSKGKGGRLPPPLPRPRRGRFFSTERRGESGGKFAKKI